MDDAVVQKAIRESAAFGEMTGYFFSKLFISSSCPHTLRVFCGKFMENLKVAFQQRKLVFSGSLQYLSDANHFQLFLNRLRRKNWVVYAKPHSADQNTSCTISLYTHRIATSNHRLLSFDGKEVTFRWKDYAHGNKKRKMTFSADEFLRRFLLHVLPGGFVRIRHFGFLS